MLRPLSTTLIVTVCVFLGFSLPTASLNDPFAWAQDISTSPKEVAKPKKPSPSKRTAKKKRKAELPAETELPPPEDFLIESQSPPNQQIENLELPTFKRNLPEEAPAKEDASKKEPDKRITIVTKDLKPTKDAKELATFVIITGRFTQKDWSLLHQGRKVALNKDGYFRVYLKAPTYRTPLELFAIGPTGEAKQETFLVSRPKDFAKEDLDPKAKRLNISPGIGFTYINFSDSRISPFTFMSITPKLAVSYILFPPRFDIAVNTFMNVISFGSTQTDLPKFLGINFRLGYRPPWFKFPWNFSIMLGGYFLKMIVPNNAYGFSVVTGPQLFPSIRYTFKNGASMGTYFKLSPVSDSFQILNLSSREIATGLSYAFRPNNRKFIGLSFDYADLKVVISGVTISSQTLTFGGSYHF